MSTPGKLILTSDPGGPRVRMVTGKSEITARDRLDYLRPTRVLIAYGDALAVEPGREVRGDTLTAYLNEAGGTGRQQFSSVDAVGNVDVTTTTERITADRGRYDGASDTATFTGQVQNHQRRQRAQRLSGGFRSADRVQPAVALPSRLGRECPGARRHCAEQHKTVDGGQNGGRCEDIG